MRQQWRYEEKVNYEILIDTQIRQILNKLIKLQVYNVHYVCVFDFENNIF